MFLNRLISVVREKPMNRANAKATFRLYRLKILWSSRKSIRTEMKINT